MGEPWYKRLAENIRTSTKEKKQTPEGLWHKCQRCKKVTLQTDLEQNLYICPHCDYHGRIGSEEYFQILFDNAEFTELFENLISGDPLNFIDSKPYTKRIEETIHKTGLKDAARTAVGKVENHDLLITCMDFGFIGGSMGSVVGEKIARSIDYCREHKVPFLMISKSGGARMMEAAYSLMQMAKTSAKLALLAQDKIPYISLLTDPTTGGVTASFAMLGDFNIAEPEALIGFAGPRVIRETIGKDLPKGFQSSEFLLEHGFLDLIVNRKNLKKQIALILDLLENKRIERSEGNLIDA
jgi:acetyl-CoA carboxylase carboxyl transferase subunit beta